METTTQAAGGAIPAHTVESHYLDIYDTLSDAEKWPTVRSWIDKDPLNFFKELRQHRPILVTPECTLVAGFEDVIEVLRQPKTFTVQLYKPKMGDYLMTEDETPMHDNEKSIMLEHLKNEDLSRIRGYIARKANELLSSANGKIDITHDYGRLLPALMVQHIFGLDGISPRKLIEWSYWNQYDAFRNQHFHEAGDSRHVHNKTRIANFKLGLYMGMLILRKGWHILRGKPKNDTVTRVLQGTHPKAFNFNIMRKGINSGGLLIGAVETTNEAVAHIMDQLTKRPEMMALAIELAQQDDTQAFDNICWEALRFYPIAPYIFRKSAVDYKLAEGSEHATTIPKGTTVLSLIASAMFDPIAFEDPDTFNPQRGFGRSFHFGYGSHECMGKIVGMEMIPEMVRQLLRRPGIKAEGSMEMLGKPFPERFMFSWDKSNIQ